MMTITMTITTTVTKIDDDNDDNDDNLEMAYRPLLSSDSVGQPGS